VSSPYIAGWLTSVKPLMSLTEVLSMVAILMLAPSGAIELA
jgi:hypothetical protein